MFKKPRKLSQLSVAKTADPQPSTEAQSSPEGPVCSLEEHEHMISEAAYFRAEQRGFSSGNELDDWLQAEAEIDSLIQGGGSRSARSVEAA